VKKAIVKQITGPTGIQGPQGVKVTPKELVDFVATVGMFFALKVVEAMLSTGQSITKQATKAIEKKFK